MKHSALTDSRRRARLASARHDAALARAALHEGCWQAAFDGSAVGGLGRMSAGGVLYAPDGAVHELTMVLPGQGCNNEAELRALVMVLQALQGLGARRLHVWGDSDLVLRQLRGEHLDKAVRLTRWRDEMLALARGFDAVTATWVPRHRNGRADALAARAVAPVLVETVTRRPSCEGTLDAVHLARHPDQGDSAWTPDPLPSSGMT